MIGTQIGQKIIHLETIDSTNNYTATMFKSGKIRHGAVIMADVQTMGKGQRGKSWVSQPFDNLTFSVVLEFQQLRDMTPMAINHLVSLSLVDFISKFSSNIRIKWPNDIYVNDQKIAGILIENQRQGDQFISSIVGVGLNINQTNFGELNATSLSLLTQKRYHLKELLFSWIASINKRLQHTNCRDELHEQFEQLLWRKDTLVEFQQHQQLKSGILRGSNNLGQIAIEINGELHYYHNSEIQLKV
jgi:BirA family transcriptional regulator, biotin operon repressor / biotin---[acetyl-CoA-carboxylase] ligase